MIHIAAGPELRGFRVAVGQQVALAQQTLELAGHGGAGVDKDDTGGQHLRQERLEEGIVGATKNDSVAAGAEQRFDVTLQHLAQGWAVQVTAFNQLDQARAGLGDDPNIRGEAVQQRSELGALQGAGGSEYADHAAAGGGGSICASIGLRKG